MNLEMLTRTYPLSARWQPPTVFSREFTLGDFKLPTLGLVAKDASGLAVTGSAAGVEERLMLRCYFELLERTSILEAEATGEPLWLWNRKRTQKRECSAPEVFPVSPAPEKWRYAKSNGIAAHVEWSSACESAEAELVERHRVLRSWFGGYKPEWLAFSKSAVPPSLWEHYEFEAYLLPGDEGTGWEVCAFFGWPRQPSAPMIHGFGAKRNRPDALALAMRECLQRLGFLWGEAIPSELPKFSPSPAYHQEMYLHEEGKRRIAHWLAEGHGRGPLPERKASGETGFVDLTPPHLRGKIFVAKALDANLYRLAFGACAEAAPEGFPEHLLVHPVM